MFNRRVAITNQQLDGRLIANAAGVAGEDFETEVNWPHGLVSGVDGEALLYGIGNDADNQQAGPPIGARAPTPGATTIYYDPAADAPRVEVYADKVVIYADGKNLTIQGGKITTDMDIETSGDIKAGGDVKAGNISLKTHPHGGVQTGSGVSGGPQ